MGQKKIRDERWNRLLREAYEARDALSPEAKTELLSIVDRICDLGEQHQIAPRVMAAAVAAAIGTLSMIEADGDVHANEHFDRFVEWGHAAIHVAVASARLNAGWTPSGPN